MAGLEACKTYEEKIELLETIIQQGIEKLLNEAETNNMLDAPYGRKPEPTPLISEQDWENELKASKASGLPINQIPETAPDCEFTYGFDALQYFSNFIDWSHPVNIEKRYQEKVAAKQALEYRTAHARNQLNVADSLRATVDKQSSGILWGPFTTPITPTSVLVSVKPLKLGTLITQVSSSPDFTEDLNAIQSTVLSEKHDPEELIDIKLEDVVPVKEVIQGLLPSTKYYIRCCLQEAPAAPLFEGTASTYFQISHFTTLPSDDDSGHSPVSTGVDDSHSEERYAPVSLMAFGSMSTSIMKPKSRGDASTVQQTVGEVGEVGKVGKVGEATIVTPLVHCLLGDLLSSNTQAIDPSHTLSVKQQLSGRISELFAHGFFSTPSSFFRTSSLLLGWRDTTIAAASSIRQEESVCKQYQKELRKYQKKYNIGPGGKKGKKAPSGSAAPPPPPVLTRPILSPAFHTLIESFPTDFNSDVMEIPPTADPGALKTSSMVYRSILLGPELQVFLLDIRDSTSAASNEGSYLGKDQAGWLYGALEDSQALWKVILCGKSFGLVTYVSEATEPYMPEVHPSNQEDSETDGEGLLYESMAELNVDSPGKEEAMDETKSDVAELSPVPLPPIIAVETEVNMSEGVLESAISPTNATVKEKRVGMIIPEPASHKTDEDDVDELGRSKYSLQYVLSTLQISKYRPANDISSSVYLSGSRSDVQTGSSDTESIDMASVQLPFPAIEEAAIEEIKLDANGLPLPLDAINDPGLSTSPLQLEAGIVLLTSSNIARPAMFGDYSTTPIGPAIPAVPTFVCAYSDLHSPTDEMSVGSYPAMPVSVIPTSIATTDTKDKEIPMFCAEVSIGQGGTAAPAAAAVIQSITHKFLDGIDATVLYSTNASSACLSGGDAETLAVYSSTAVPMCSLSLLPDGVLSMQLLYVPTNQVESEEEGKGVVKGAVVFECKFQTFPAASHSTDDQD